MSFQGGEGQAAQTGGKRDPGLGQALRRHAAAAGQRAYKCRQVGAAQGMGEARPMGACR
jgi:hypothetical protein